MEDKADGESNCLSWIPFLSRLWLNVYSRIARVTVISGFSSGIGMRQKRKAIPKRAWKHVNYRILSPLCCCCARLCLQLFNGNDVQMGFCRASTTKNNHHVPLNLLPISTFLYSFRLCRWGPCPAATVRLWIETHLSKAQLPLRGNKGEKKQVENWLFLEL